MIDENKIIAHREYLDSVYIWRFVQDALAGESAIKRGGTRYLPMPAAMLALPAPAAVQGHMSGSNNSRHLDASIYGTAYTEVPFSHPNPAYQAYLQRARYPVLVSHTVRSLLGIAGRKPPVVTAPDDMEYLLELLPDIFNRVVASVLSYGRVWPVVDIDDDGNFTVVVYQALDGVDWKEHEYVVLRERVNDTGDDSTDIAHKRLKLSSEDGKQSVYTVETAAPGKITFDEADVTVPVFKGRTLDVLPVVCCGSVDLDWKTDSVPVEGILSCAGQIFMKNADLAQAEFLSCNPTLVLTGVDVDSAPKAIGATVALVLPATESTAQYIEPSGSSLNIVVDDIKSLFEEANSYGAQLLGASKSQVESGEALRLRQNASGATLLSVMQLANKTISGLLDIIASWSGRNRDLFTFDFDSDLSEITLTPQELDSIVKAWMAGSISYDTLFTRLQQGGIADPQRTADEELALIEQEGPSVAPVVDDDNKDDDNEDDNKETNDDDNKDDDNKDDDNKDDDTE